MITIQTRQNREGKWWCNTTFNCEDISVERSTITEAQEELIKTLILRGHDGTVNWDKPKFYESNMGKLKSSKDHIIYVKLRIDNNPIA